MKSTRRQKIFSYAPQVVMLWTLVLFLSVTEPAFLTKENLSNIFIGQVPFLLLLSLGMTISVIVRGLDLSIGSNMALSSCIAGLVMKQAGMLPGILSGLLTGCLLGMANGILIAKVRLPAFIATYGMDWIGKGLAYVLMMGTTAYGFSPAFRSLSLGSTAGIPHLLLICLTGFAVVCFLFSRTVFGWKVYAVGLNTQGAVCSGVEVDRILTGAYMLNGLLAGLTGLLYISQLDAVDPTIAEGWSMKLIAAVLIGGASMKGGRATMGHTLFGVLILAILTNGINLWGVSSLWQQVVTGCVILFSILLEQSSRLFRAYMEKRQWEQKEKKI